MRKILLLNSGRKAIAGMAEGTFWKRICLVYFQRKILVPFVHGVSKSGKTKRTAFAKRNVLF